MIQPEKEVAVEEGQVSEQRGVLSDYGQVQGMGEVLPAPEVQPALANSSRFRTANGGWTSVPALLPPTSSYPGV